MKKWTSNELDYLINNYENFSIIELANKLNRTKHSISHKLFSLRLLKLNKLKVGNKYRLFTVIEIFKNKKIKIKCECGKEKIISKSNWYKSHSCGCDRQNKLKIKIGDKFNYLTVLSISNKKIHRSICYNCRCDCGKMMLCKAHELFSNIRKSCGCHKKGNKNHLYKGVENLSGSYWSTIVCGAKKRKLEISITKEYIWNLFLKQNGICKLSGIPIILYSSYSSEQTASLDRIDNNKGYIEGNVQWVHKDVNIMKIRLSQEKFIDLCTKIYLYTKKTDEGMRLDL